MTAASRTLAPPHALLAEGRNCWRIEHADGLHVIQDAAEYFRLAREAMLQARHTIFIVGWDISATVNLLPGAEGEEAPTRLGPLLDFVVARRPSLRCYIVVWDYMALYALERDPFSPWRFRLTDRRVRFRFDDRHPLGASHHQKLLVVDDRLAFCGGIDLTGHRWDTSEHRIEEPLRANLVGKHYGPYHEVQAMLEGPAAGALGVLARQRWHRAGRRHRPPPVRPAQGSLWPGGVERDLADVDVAICRTEPAFLGRPEVRECERLFLDAIAAARRTLYIENQYFTSKRLMEALCARLREPGGPEVVVVVPRECAGWLEQKTMGVMRDEALRMLASADGHGRFRALYPAASVAAGVPVFVHSKVMIVDDELLRVGSANMSDRSLGLDTECDLAVAAAGQRRISEGILDVRDRLVGEHLGASPGDVARAVKRLGSLRAAVDALAGADRTLVRIDVDLEDRSAMGTTAREAVDPAEPMQLTREVEGLYPDIEQAERARGWILVRILLSLAALAILAWSWGGTAWAGADELRDLLASVPPDPALMGWTLAAFVLAGTCFFPLRLLILGTVVLLGPLRGGLVALAGSLACAAIGYGIGTSIGLRALAPFTGRRVYRLGALLGRGGAVTVALLRFLAITSAASTHLLCGAAGVPFGAFLAGSLLDLLGEVLVLAATGGLLRLAILDGGMASALIATLLSSLLALLALRWRERLLMRRLEPALQARAARAELG